MSTSNAPLTHIVCIIDRSGSMQPIAADAIGGYNSFLENQRKLPGEAVVTLVLFDHEYQRICSARPIAEAPRLSRENYVPRGTTALLDAIGRTIDDIRNTKTSAAKTRSNGRAHRSESAKVIVVILTDGMENASTDYSHEAVAAGIKEMRLELGWEFVYLGANQDAISVAGKMNIPAPNSASFDADSAGMTQACRIMDERVMYSRRTRDDGDA